jgi:hypothetical protein
VIGYALARSFDQTCANECLYVGGMRVPQTIKNTRNAGGLLSMEFILSGDCMHVGCGGSLNRFPSACDYDRFPRLQGIARISADARIEDVERLG